MSANLYLCRHRRKITLKGAVAISITNKHTWIVLNIALGNENLYCVYIHNNRGKGQSSSIYLIDWQILI